MISLILILGLMLQKSLSFLTTRKFGQLAMKSSLKLSVVPSSGMMDNIIQRINENNDVSEKEFRNFIPFKVGNMNYGLLIPEFADRLVVFKDVFVESQSTGQRVLRFVPQLESADAETRTSAVATVTKSLKDQGVISGWRNELFPVVSEFSSPPAFLLERAAYSFFGVKGYGVHVNGYVRGVSGRIEKLWVATRAPNKSTWPSMLDHIVAGGLAYGISPTNTVVKECAEEANIPESLALMSQAVGAVSYRGKDEYGRLKRDALFCFDLELPPDFTPTPVDGEVESFQLRDLSWVLDRIVEGGPKGYKPNCNLVVLDFLVRHGVISPEAPRYLELVSSLRSGESNRPHTPFQIVQRVGKTLITNSQVVNGSSISSPSSQTGNLIQEVIYIKKRKTIIIFDLNLTITTD
eukprot:gene8817-18248_t